MPILRPYDVLGSTRYVGFDTTRPTWLTDPAKCHVSHVVADTDSWEQKLAQVLEEMPEVIRYVKNQGLGFTIPYSFNGEARSYIPDFIAVIDDGRGPDDLVQLIVEVTGEKKKDKAEKVATARQLWIPAVNNHAHFGRWAFLEITDPWDAASTIRATAACGAAPLRGRQRISPTALSATRSSTTSTPSPPASSLLSSADEAAATASTALERSIRATLAASACAAARATAGRPAPDSIASESASSVAGSAPDAAPRPVWDFEDTPGFWQRTREQGATGRGHRQAPVCEARTAAKTKPGKDAGRSAKRAWRNPK